MSTPADEAYLKWLESDFRRMSEQDVRNEEADKYAQRNSSSKIVPGFMGLWRRWPI